MFVVQAHFLGPPLIIVILPSAVKILVERNKRQVFKLLKAGMGHDFGSIKHENMIETKEAVVRWCEKGES